MPATTPFFVPFWQEATGGVSRFGCERDGPNVALAAWSRRVPFLSRLRAAASMDWARLALGQPVSPFIFLILSAWVFVFLCEGMLWAKALAPTFCRERAPQDPEVRAPQGLGRPPGSNAATSR